MYLIIVNDCLPIQPLGCQQLIFPSYKKLGQKFKRGSAYIPSWGLSLMIKCLILQFKEYTALPLFTVKLQRLTYMWSNFQLLDIQGAKRQFPSEKPLLVLIFSSSASIKAIIMPHATESTSTPCEKHMKGLRHTPRHWFIHLPQRREPHISRMQLLFCLGCSN